MIRHSSTPENSISSLIDVLDDQEEYFSEMEISSSSLREGLESLAEFDKDVREEICSYIIALLRSGAISSSVLPNLIRTISFQSDANQEDLEPYGASRGAMTWSNFEIILHDSLKEKDEEGNFSNNIRHHFGHELGHSIMESKSIDLEEISNFLEEIPLDFESTHIVNLVSNGADAELICKERFAEYIGIYLQSRSAKEPNREFLRFRANKISPKAENEFIENQDKFMAETQKIFEFIDHSWPHIQARIGQNGFLADLEEFDDEIASQNNLPELPEPSVEPSTPIESISPNHSDGNSELKSVGNKNGKTFNESPDLARKENHSPGFLSAAKDFLASVGSALDPFGIN